jgi:hypothetical protein
MSGGHRALVRVDLVPTCEGGLKSAIGPGHRSVAYLFEPLGEEEDPMGFGAVVEEVLEGGAPGQGLLAVVRFWADLAEVYATPGTEFDVWLGRVVGHGRVLEICAD